MSEEEIITNFKGNLIDYIDNLQQENSQLKEDIKGFEQERQTLYNTIHNLQKANKQVNRKIEKAIEYNKELSELYDIGSMERSNADTNLLILGDKETINLLKGDKE